MTTAAAALYSALSGLAGGRVYLGVAPINTALPFITYTRIGGAPSYVLTEGRTATVQGRFQIEVWDDSPVDAETLAGQVKTALDTLKSQLLLEMLLQDDETKEYRVLLDYHVWKYEA